MRGQLRLKITTSLAPYDVSVLILIYFYCYEGVHVQAPIFVTLIAPTIPSLEINPILEKDLQGLPAQKPLSPFLEPLVSYLISVDKSALAVKLVSFLESMKSLDVLTQLLRTLGSDCLVKDYRLMRNKSRKLRLRRVTKTSLIGAYLEKCLIKYQVSDFDDRETLWDSLTGYLTAFKDTPTWNSIKLNVDTMSFKFMSDSHADDDGMISYFQELCQELQPTGSKYLMIGYTHFRSLLNGEIFNMSQRHTSEVDTDLRLILQMLSLNEMTHFPAIHILRYLEAVASNYYQAALDALHNYFDYMLTQNDENCFHISLLCLATFHTRVHDSPAAIKAFEEATKVARENKDIETLNLIMIWVVDFIEKNPEHSDHFQITVDQIVRYLKSCADNENPLVFEHAYKFESLLLMMENSNPVLVLESTFKYMVIALQRLESGSVVSSVLDHCAKIWDSLGYTAISQVYWESGQAHEEEIDLEINAAYEALNTGNLEPVNCTLRKLKSPNLTYEQDKKLKMLQIKYYTHIEDYISAMKHISQCIGENRTRIVDNKWKFRFELEKCKVMLACGIAIRCVPRLMEILNSSLVNENSLQFSECLILLCQSLKEAGKTNESLSLMRPNLPVVLQYPQFEREVLNIMRAQCNDS